MHPKEEVLDMVWSDINEFVIYCALVCTGTPLLFLFSFEVVTLQKFVAWLTGADNDKQWKTSCQHTIQVFCILHTDCLDLFNRCWNYVVLGILVTNGYRTGILHA